MRITAEAKTETRERILKAAARLFKTKGWHETTTRGIAVAARIATGTLFNYFPTKEAVAADLIATALRRASEESCASRSEETSLDAELFAFIWSGLSRLREFREFLAPASETIFSPLARSSRESAGDAIRIDHLRCVEEII